MRALPPRTAYGSLPLVGQLHAGSPYWLCVGLGSRGLVYHAWLGQLLADAILHGHALPLELTAWRGVPKESASFESP